MTNQRTVMHIDFDSFFASVEQQANPLLRGKPIGVTGSSPNRGIVCAASKEAKKYGIKTGIPTFKTREMRPTIILVKGDFTKYQYVHKKSLEVFNQFSDLVEPFSIDEAFMDVTQTINFFKTPQNICRQIKDCLGNVFGSFITCSIGVGPNKLLAKLASDLNKPDGFFEVTKNNIDEVLKKTSLKDFCGIGSRVEARLNRLGVYSIRQLQEIALETLRCEFGNKESIFLKNLSFGIDKEPVKSISYRRVPKSIGHQHTLSKNTRDIKVIKTILGRLASMVGRRLRKNKMKGKTISLYLRDRNMQNYHEQTTLTTPASNDQKLLEAVEKILASNRWSGVISKEIRLVGIAVSNLTPEELATCPLLPLDQRMEKINLVSDAVNDRFGEFTIVTANTLIADITKGMVGSFLKY